MDGVRFDGWSRGIARRFSRRRVVGSAGGAGLLSVVGTGEWGAAATQNNGFTCVLAFTATVRIGPSVGGPAGKIEGELRLKLDRDGAVTDGEFEVGNVIREVTGQATGTAVTLRIATASDGDPGILVVVGAGEALLVDCRGTYSGLVSGPEEGDIGDWIAMAPQPHAEPGHPVEEDACAGVEVFLCDAPCQAPFATTVTCACVTTGSAVCDEECAPGQVLTDDCECVCLQ